MVELDDKILVTGAAGFIGRRVVAELLALGFRGVTCLIRPSSDPDKLRRVFAAAGSNFEPELIVGNLLSREDCETAARDAAVIYHLAAGRGEKSFPDAFLNSVVTARNLLDAARSSARLKRFVNVSSFAVYSNRDKASRLLDESSPLESAPHLRGDAYAYAKSKQEQLLKEYGERYGIPYVIVRPGVVYGPGNEQIHGRIGLGTFGIFLHLGGRNSIPLTYVDNCADAIVLAGLKEGVDEQTFNVVDDDLPSSRQFLKLYKENVRRFSSLYVPHWLSYVLCYLWESYSRVSRGQLPPVYNRRLWHAVWKGTSYSNAKARQLLGWTPRLACDEALQRYFESCRAKLACS